MEAFLTVLWLTFSGLDIATTEYALNNHPTYLQEGNFLAQRKDIRISYNIAVPVGYFLVRPKMSKKERYIALSVLATVRGFAVVNNINAIRTADGYKRSQKQAQRWGNSYPWQRLEFASGY